jgi:hypothetical protein
VTYLEVYILEVLQVVRRKGDALSVPEVRALKLWYRKVLVAPVKYAPRHRIWVILDHTGPTRDQRVGETGELLSPTSLPPAIKADIQHLRRCDKCHNVYFRMKNNNLE